MNIDELKEKLCKNGPQNISIKCEEFDKFPFSMNLEEKFISNSEFENSKRTNVLWRFYAISFDEKIESFSKDSICASTFEAIYSYIMKE